MAWNIISKNLSNSDGYFVDHSASLKKSSENINVVIYNLWLITVICTTNTAWSCVVNKDSVDLFLFCFVAKDNSAFVNDDDKIDNTKKKKKKKPTEKSEM